MTAPHLWAVLGRRVVRRHRVVTTCRLAEEERLPSAGVPPHGVLSISLARCRAVECPTKVAHSSMDAFVGAITRIKIAQPGDT